MAFLGAGKMMKNQKIAAEAARSRGRRRTQHQEQTEEVVASEIATCSNCGKQFFSDRMLWTENGLQCNACAADST